METYLALACLLAPFAAALWVLPAFKTAPQVEGDPSERHELRAWEEPSQLDPRPWPLKRVFEDSNNGLLAWGRPLALFTGSLITLAYVGMTSSEDLSDMVALLAVPGAGVLLWSGAKLGRLLLEARVAAPGVLTLSEPLTAGRHIQFLFERPLRSPFDLGKASASLVLLEHVPKGRENHTWEPAYTIDLPSDRMGADGKSLRACWRVHLPERDAPPRASAPSKYRWVLTIELHGKRTWDLKSTFEIPFSHAPVRASVTADDPLAENPYQPGQARRATDSPN